MIFNNLFKRLFNRVTFTKVFVIFIVGFCSRVLINYFYGVNVFVEYFNSISLIYYVFMSLFIVVINEVIVFFEFDLMGVFGSFIRLFVSFIAYFIKLFFDILGVNNFHYLDVNNDNLNNKPFSKKHFTLQRNGDDHSGDSGRRGNKSGWKSRNKSGWKSAALGGLYGTKGGSSRPSAGVSALYSSIEGNSKVERSRSNISLFNNLKCRLCWYSFVKFNGNYNSYNDYKNSVNGNVSIRETVKNIFK